MQLTQADDGFGDDGDDHNGDVVLDDGDNDDAVVYDDDDEDDEGKTCDDMSRPPSPGKLLPTS